jgi:hypothetical protein
MLAFEDKWVKRDGIIKMICSVPAMEWVKVRFFSPSSRASSSALFCFSQEFEQAREAIRHRGIMNDIMNRADARARKLKDVAPHIPTIRLPFPFFASPSSSTCSPSPLRSSLLPLVSFLFGCHHHRPSPPAILGLLSSTFARIKSAAAGAGNSNLYPALYPVKLPQGLVDGPDWPLAPPPITLSIPSQQFHSLASLLSTSFGKILQPLLDRANLNLPQWMKAARAALDSERTQVFRDFCLNQTHVVGTDESTHCSIREPVMPLKERGKTLVAVIKLEDREVRLLSRSLSSYIPSLPSSISPIICFVLLY